MKIDLAGKRAIVAGGSRGIGRAIALAFGKAGAGVSICARGAERLAVTRDEIARHGGGDREKGARSARASNGATGVEHAGHAHTRASAAPDQSVEPPPPLREPSASSRSATRRASCSIRAKFLSLAALRSAMECTIPVFCAALSASRALR
jgi:NAD(P)-dependent dehydrogenase (short-subunit alcohol dehydrogenase family)